jgi:hypothetical protein
LASFCHFSGLPYHFLYTKNHLEWSRSYMGGIWSGMGTIFIDFQKIKKNYGRSINFFSKINLSI